MAPERWTKVRLGAFIKALPGYAFKSSSFSDAPESGPPLVRIRDLLPQQPSVYIAGEYPPGFEVHPGDILVGMDGDFLACRWKGPHALLNQRVCRVEPSDSAVLSDEFLFQVLQPNLDQLHRGVGRTTVKHLSTSLLANVEVQLPPLAEQREIAATLKAVDDAIAAGEMVANELALVQRALTEDLVRCGLPGDRVEQRQDSPRTPPPHWVDLQVASLFSKPARVACPAVQTLQYQESGRYPVVDQGKAAVAGYVDDPSLLYSGPLPVIVFGDHTREWKYMDVPFAVGADGTQLLIPKPEVHPRFLYYALSTLPIRNLGYARHFKLLKEMTVRMPPYLAEQRRISEALDAFAAALHAELQHLRQLKTLKPALASKLLSGKIRVRLKDAA